MDKKEQNTPRLLQEYRDRISSVMEEKFGYGNIFAVPKIEKIVINMGIGEGSSDSKLVDKAADELAIITGQRPKICRSRKPISNFKLRENAPIGCCVTLRGAMMYEFFDRLITVALPRIRDFRGFSASSFDGNGNYTFGLLEQTAFVEIDADRVTRTQGMNVSIKTSAGTDDEGRELLKLFGFPFKRRSDGN
ncbi:MAG: 50S ribosomal protein L5 [Candidatus Omnitrophica bacterium]|nr:50S ribosomal protein L5 [Candidatus Omnitrophota bacterium]